MLSRHRIRSIVLQTLLVLASVVLLHHPCRAEDSQDRPNVLFLISDDLNNALGCYDHPLVESPNIDRLAARGVRFDRAYCQYPLCGPSRNSMLTGLYPDSTGIHQNSQIFRQTIPSQRSLSHAFRMEGYFAARIGKLYHYNVPRSIGTNGHDDPASWELELNPAGCDRMLEEPDTFTLREGQFGGTLSWYASPRDDLLHTDGMLATDAIWVLERCAREKRPFFLAVGFYRPHTPYTAPAKYFDGYSLPDMPLVQGWEADREDLPADALGSTKREWSLLNDDLRRQAIQAYFASITFMDAQVGRILDSLDELGLSDNTIIVMTSDHGYHLGEHGLWQKMSLFEQSARVPMIISVPGMETAGRSAAAPVGLIDLYPTLASLCNVTPPDNLQGQSLTPILDNPDELGRGWALTQVRRGGRENPRMGYALRTPRWRYTEWDQGNKGRELYDHETDPLELTNLADDPDYVDRVSELSATLREAVSNTLPPSGQVPTIKRDGLWAPNLIDP